MAETLTTVPYESSVAVAAPVLVGYCLDKDCNVVYDPYPGPGTYCDNEHKWQNWRPTGERERRKLHKRLMWKCPVCDFYFATRRGLLDHEHTWL